MNKSRLVNRCLGLLVVLVAALMLVAPAAAAPAANDTFAGAITVAALPEVAVTVDPKGIIDHRTGVVTVSGTFTCANADEAFVEVEVTQRVGRFTITGLDVFVTDTCDGASHPWSVEVAGENGKFAGSKVNARAFVFACGPDGCVGDDAIQTIRLRQRPK